MSENTIARGLRHAANRAKPMADNTAYQCGLTIAEAELAADEIDRLAKRCEELETALREIVNGAPACGPDGQLFYAHFDEVGNEIGIENVDPVGCVGSMVSTAQAALAAQPKGQP